MAISPSGCGGETQKQCPERDDPGRLASPPGAAYIFHMRSRSSGFGLVIVLLAMLIAVVLAVREFLAVAPQEREIMRMNPSTQLRENPTGSGQPCAGKARQAARRRIPATPARA